MKHIYYYIFGVLLLVSPSNAVAQSSAEQFIDVQKQLQAVYSNTAWLLGETDLNKRLSTLFYLGLSSTNQGDKAAAQNHFLALRQQLQENGFKNAPSFSFELLRSAKQLQEQGELEAARMQVAQAITLSPKHPRVLLSAFGFFELVGYSTAWSHLVDAVKFVPDYPLVGITMFLNLAIVLGISLSLAFLVVSVIQLLRGGEHLVKEVGKLFPRAFAGLAGAIILPLCLVGPLFLGLLAALAVWSMLLSLYRPRCRYYAFAVAGVILLWSWLIPNARVIGIQTQLSQMQAVEELNVGNYNPDGEERLTSLMSKGEATRGVILGSALVAQRNDQPKIGREIYASLTNDSFIPKSLKQLFLLNTAELYYRGREYKKALAILEKLEKQGFARFEMYHNAALAYIALTETQKYREYYAKAGSIDPARQDLLQLSAVDGVAPSVNAKLEFSDFWSLVNMSAAPSVSDAALEAALANALLRSSSPKILEIVAGATLFVGVFGVLGTMQRSRRRRKSTVFVANSSKNEGSVLWCVLPAGYAIAGRYPLAGAFYLSIVIASLVLAFGAPMNLFGIAPVKSALFQPFLVVAAALLLISTTWSLMLYRRSPGLDN